MEHKTVYQYKDLPEDFDDIDLYELFEDKIAVKADIFEDGSVTAYDAQGREVFLSSK